MAIATRTKTSALVGSPALMVYVRDTMEHELSSAPVGIVMSMKIPASAASPVPMEYVRENNVEEEQELSQLAQMHTAMYKMMSVSAGTRALMGHVDSSLTQMDLAMLQSRLVSGDISVLKEGVKLAFTHMKCAEG